MDNVPEGAEELAEAIRATRPTPDWPEWAACAGMDPHAFFPGPGDRLGRERACETCDTCIVWQECLAHALAHPDRGGIRAGTTERTRRKIRRALKEAPSAPAKVETCCSTE